VLDHQSYESGAAVSGEVVLQLEKSKRVHGVEVIFSGQQSDYTWIVPKEIQTNIIPKDPKRLCGNHSLSEEEMAKTSIQNLKNNSMVLESGEHRWKFCYQLPSRIPPTMNNRLTKVGYQLQARAMIPWKQDIVCIKNVHVGNGIENSASRLPKEFAHQKTIRWNSNNYSKEEILKITAKLENRYLKPGDSLILHISIENNSGKEVKAVILKAKTQVNLKLAPASRRTILQTDCYEPNTLPLQKGTWNQTVVEKLPTSLLPTVKNCSAMTVKHYLSLVVKVAFSTQKIKIPFYIESVPLSSVPRERSNTYSKSRHNSKAENGKKFTSWPSVVPRESKYFNL